MIKKALLLVCIPVSAFYLKAQDISVLTNTIDVYSNNTINGSAKYNAMAGSAGALGGEISSINNNPAGVGVFIANDINLTLGINSNKNSTTFANQTIDYKLNNTNISNTGAVVSFNISNNNQNKWKFVNIGINYSSHSIENYSESAGNKNIKIVDDYSFTNKVNYTYLGHAYDRYGDVSKTNFAVGANYDNRLYFGLGLNFHDSYINQFDTAAFHSDFDNTVASYSKQYTGYEESANGFSASLGVIAKLNNQFRVGLALETPTWWNIDRIYNEHYLYDPNFNNTSELYAEDRKLSTPMKATLSAAYVPNKNFSFNIDYIQGLTNPKYKEHSLEEVNLNDVFSDSYKKYSEVRVGGEYRFNGFRFRGGYAYQGNSFDNITLYSYNNDGTASNNKYSNLLSGETNIIGLGLGYDFRAFYLDFSYQNISSKYKSPFLEGNANLYSGYYNSGFDVNSEAFAVSSVKNNRNNFFITLGWKF